MDRVWWILLSDHGVCWPVWAKMAIWDPKITILRTPKWPFCVYIGWRIQHSRNGSLPVTWNVGLRIHDFRVADQPSNRVFWEVLGVEIPPLRGLSTPHKNKKKYILIEPGFFALLLPFFILFQYPSGSFSGPFRPFRVSNPPFWPLFFTFSTPKWPISHPQKNSFYLNPTFPKTQKTRFFGFLGPFFSKIKASPLNSSSSPFFSPSQLPHQTLKTMFLPYFHPSNSFLTAIFIIFIDFMVLRVLFTQKCIAGPPFVGPAGHLR